MKSHVKGHYFTKRALLLYFLEGDEFIRCAHAFINYYKFSAIEIPTQKSYSMSRLYYIDARREESRTHMHPFNFTLR